MPTRETPTHSPAPWAEDDDGDIEDAGGNCIVVTPDLSAEDRRLIRKAPELLAAVRRWLLRCESGTELFHASNYAEMSALVEYIDTGSV